jgi:hypothetical protein
MLPHVKTNVEARVLVSAEAGLTSQRKVAWTMHMCASLTHPGCCCCLCAQVIDFSSVTSMYGSVHCASQVVRRVPSRFVAAQTPLANGNGNPGLN